MPKPVSYSQRFEDLYLGCCFPDQRDGFYIDIGAGHPVYDNVSFAFYERGWRGIAVEPNPWLLQLAQRRAAARPQYPVAGRREPKEKRPSISSTNTTASRP